MAKSGSCLYTENTEYDFFIPYNLSKYSLQ